ncbi:glycosyl hydrolase family 28-related protein [Sphingomonas psychrotolerans]|uniref:Rhamnogalacturonase A/B/Epimerase-like pectate lyase domain-containing protein n=1 Tax=Sphingomonas psychrotolerans TaxID=1327635 RepID=A0A2K8MQG2_9SPHN|nr:glycosyl hydrolase family 28-related protein [Sphingomonas psychrotolerans]ATY33701.1 hypothetical protein CVN68_18500 [Sphingomonas psychrotolerans]
MFKVKDHGAVGDGVADDTFAIQSLLNQFGSIGVSQSTTVVNIDFGEGVYRITQPLYVKQNYLRLFGSSATIKCDGAAYGLFLSYDNSVNNLIGVQIEDLWIEGADVHGIIAQCAPQSRFRRLKITGCGGDGIAIFGSVAVKTEDCVLEDNGGWGYREQAFSKTYAGAPQPVIVGCIANEVIRPRAYRNKFGGLAFYESQQPYVLRPDLEENGETSGRGISFETVLNGVIDTPYDEKSRYAVIFEAVPRLMPAFQGGHNEVRSGQLNGELVDGAVPLSVYIIATDHNVIAGGRLAGNVQINATSADNVIMPGTFIGGTLTNNGVRTKDLR